MPKNITKNAITTTFKAMVIEMPFSKVTVTALCKRTGISRRCFYDYFKDTHDVVNSIFYEEFLSHYEVGEARHFFDDFFYNLCDYFYNNAPYYLKILSLKGQNSFRDYFCGAVVPIATPDVKKGIKEDTLAVMFIYAIIDVILFLTLEWLSSEAPISVNAFVKKTLALHASAAYNFADYVSSSSYLADGFE